MVDAVPVALVTGGGRGIGRSIAVELSSQGYSVAVVSRTESELLETVALCKENKIGAYQEFLALANDVTSEREVTHAIHTSERELGPIQLLVNNAGFVDPVGLLEMSGENWNQTVATNLTAVFLTCREFARGAKGRGGKIVNIASTAGLSARPGWSAYAASKAAVVNLSATLSEELRQYGIRVYCIAPGRTATALRQRLAPREDQAKILQPAAIARLVALLASDAGMHLDDQVILIRQPVKDGIGSI